MLDLIDGVLSHIFENLSIIEAIDFEPEKKLTWLKTATSYIDEISPIVKRSKLTKPINYLNEVKRIVNAVGEVGDVKLYRKNSSKDVDRFIKKTTSYLKTVPGCFDKNILLGDTLFLQGKYEQAIKHYMKITDYFDDAPYFGLIISYLSLGNYNAAYTTYVKMQMEYPSASIWTGVTDTLSMLSVSDCIIKIENELCKNPDDIELILLKVMLSSFDVTNTFQSKGKENWKLIKKVLKKEPDNILALSEKMRLLRQNIGVYRFDKEWEKRWKIETDKMWKQVWATFGRIRDKILSTNSHETQQKAFNDLILVIKIFSQRNLVVFNKLYYKGKDHLVDNKYTYNYWDQYQLTIIQIGLDHDTLKQINDYYLRDRKRTIHLTGGNYKAAFDETKLLLEIKNKRENNENREQWINESHELISQFYCLLGLNKKKEAYAIIEKIKTISRDKAFMVRTYDNSDGSALLYDRFYADISSLAYPDKLTQNALWMCEALYKADPEIDSVNFYTRMFTLYCNDKKYNKIITPLEKCFEINPLVLKNNSDLLSSLVNNIPYYSSVTLGKVSELLLKDVFDEYPSPKQSDLIALDKLDIEYLKKNKERFNVSGEVMSIEKQIKEYGNDLFIAKKKHKIFNNYSFAWRMYTITNTPSSTGFNKRMFDLEDTYWNFFNTGALVLDWHIRVLEEKNTIIKLEKEKNKVKIDHEIKLKEAVQDLVQQYTHTLSNTLFPNTIKEVANTLKKSETYRNEVLVLEDAYQSEIMVKKQGQMLQLKQAGDSDEFQRTIRGDRLAIDSKENGIGINEIISQSVESVISRFLKQDTQKLADLRKKIESLKKIKVIDWKESYENNVFFSGKISANDWAKEKLGEVKISSNRLWDNIRVIRDNYAHSLLQSYFMELLFNALKYRDYKSKIWVSIDLGESELNGEDYLQMIISNATEMGDAESVGMGKGLRGLRNDLGMLNSVDGNKDFMEIKKDDKTFSVSAYMRKELFVMSELDDVKLPWKTKN